MVSALHARLSDALLALTSVEPGIPLWAFIFTSVTCMFLLGLVAVLGWKLLARPDRHHLAPWSDYSGTMMWPDGTMKVMRPRTRRAGSQDSNASSIGSGSKISFEDWHGCYGQMPAPPPVPEMAVVPARGGVYSSFRKGHAREVSNQDCFNIMGCHR
jgi:hypothetical protein